MFYNNIETLKYFVNHLSCVTTVYTIIIYIILKFQVSTIKITNKIL